jgi:hypothetical protein
MKSKMVELKYIKKYIDKILLSINNHDNLSGNNSFY